MKSSSRQKPRAALSTLSETAIHKNCVRWWRIQYARFVYLLFHPANGGFRNPKEAAILHGMGVVSGVSDLILLIPNLEFHGLCIEIKTPAQYRTKNHGQSDNQIMFEKWVKAAGYDYQIATSVEQFIDIVSAYMKKTPYYKPTWKDQKAAGGA